MKIFQKAPNQYKWPTDDVLLQYVKESLPLLGTGWLNVDIVYVPSTLTIIGSSQWLNLSNEKYLYIILSYFGHLVQNM